MHAGHRRGGERGSSHPLEQTAVLEVGAGVAQALEGVRQVVVGAEVETVRVQHVAHHGQEGLVLLRLKEKENASSHHTHTHPFMCNYTYTYSTLLYLYCTNTVLDLIVH